MNRNLIYPTLVFFLFLCSVSTFAQKTDPAISQKVDQLLKQMTIEEKVGQLNQYTGKALTGPASEKKNDLQTEIVNGWVGSMLNVKGVKNTREVQAMALKSRLKIPLLFGLDVIHGYEVTFPIPLAEAASWDLGAIKQAAHVAAEEAAASGIHWTFAPMVDIARDPRWGRIMEGAGEDPYLGSLIARARVKGFQGEKLGGTDAVMACAKHFAAYGAAIAGRDYAAVEMSDHELWQTYLPPFKAAAEAGVATFMNSFNTLNGIPATGNSYLQRDILKNKWNYNGFIVSDWNSIGEMSIWGYANDLKDAAEKAIIAGSDMDMEGSAYRKHLVQLVKEGKVAVALIDDAVKRILYKKFELGLFDDPYKFSDEKREQKVIKNPKNRTIARAMARKSIVLLKNDADLLPLAKTAQTIAVIGPLAKAKRDMAGSWIVNADTVSTVSLYEGLSAAVGKNQKLLFAGAGTALSSTDAEIAEAVATARQADVVVLALGETWDMSGESKSRADIHLPGDQVKLFEAIQKTGKPIIVTLMAGRPMIFNEIADKAAAILYTWWLGSEAGNAISDVIFGNYNPSAKLPVTFPRAMGQIPIYYGQTNTGRPYTNQKNKLYLSVYIDEENTPRYAFGYGLSYTKFSYSDLKLSKSEITDADSVVLSFKLTNTGKYAGEEVAQLYLRDEVASIVRPLKELKDFAKVLLKPGESKLISFVINKEKLSFYNKDLKWITEPGVFQVMLGSSSDQILLQSKFTLTR
ncbi:beta-glucosidase [Pedobacter steynii]|uniref:Beta-glucosidase n=1 Tax=Pedobacter steynii TaxID=430522 RepID=A0A1G9PFL3_9SPHI|nr:glycoside hydrolase family 3 N-terminal domain-containing protein [Pedobacter steynii]NQX39003.1 glycoside hydrolase family 3 C-terminal domain-containing protein [Pedobacter steynii]SDL97353.1 beta-glucosidase [Pedobacter steynii]